MTKVKVTTSWESNIRLKEQLYRKSVFYAFEQNWKIVSLKRDNAVQNCKYINILLKTGSWDNAIREFSLAKPSRYMSHYTMIYKTGENMRDFLGLFVFNVV